MSFHNPNDRRLEPWLPGPPVVKVELPECVVPAQEYRWVLVDEKVRLFHLRRTYDRASRPYP